MNNKTIIFGTIIFLLSSFVFLSAIEIRQSNINNKNIWMLYFSDPKSGSLDFSLENHSQNKLFHWQILLDKIVVTEGDSTVALGDIKTISVPKDNIDLSNKKITISVTDVNNNKKEIYKNF
jgi:hypothetical protein